MSSSSPEYRATQKFYKNFGEEPIEVLVKGNLQQLVLSSDVDRLVGLGGVPVGQRPGEGARRGGRRERAVRAAGEGADGEGRVRAGHVHQRGGRTDRRTADRSDQAGRSRRPSRPKLSCAKAALARGESAEAAEQARQAGELDHARRASRRASRRWRSSTGSPRGRAWTTRASSRRWCSTRTSRRARRRRASPTCSRAAKRRLISVRLKAGLSERAADAHDRADPPGGGDEAVAAAARGELSGDGRAGDRRRPDGRDHALDRAAAGGGACW